MTVVREPFNIGRNESCYCGSGYRFKRCCGSSDANRRAPYDISIVDHFASLKECWEILAIACARASERLKLIDPARSTAQEIVRMYYTEISPPLSG
jgi:hypothetical protein